MKAGAFVTDTLLDPATRDSFAVDKTGFNAAYKTPLPFWAWIELPGNERDLQLFGLAMEGMTNFFVRDTTDGFDFGSVEAGGVVVDVGGGVGSSTMMYARKYKHLKYVVQDRDMVITQAQNVSMDQPWSWFFLTVTCAVLEGSVPGSHRVRGSHFARP